MAGPMPYFLDSCKTHFILLCMQMCRGYSIGARHGYSEPCSEQCKLRAIRVGHAILWPGRRAPDSKVHLGQRSTKYEVEVVNASILDQGGASASMKLLIPSEMAAQRQEARVRMFYDRFPKFGHAESIKSSRQGACHVRKISISSRAFTELHDRVWLVMGTLEVEVIEKAINKKDILRASAAY